jgi:hypothetical protein
MPSDVRNAEVRDLRAAYRPSPDAGAPVNDAR